MKLDHFVVNISREYQTDDTCIGKIRAAGFPYEPKYGKGTNGFKVSNLWIGDEYFEMLNLLKKSGGGWVEEWTALYNQGHKGLVCLMLDVDDIEALYINVVEKGIDITKPEWLKFKWFFQILTRTMPWKNAYIPFFQKVPLQIGFQQMKDDKSREFMRQYMVPNSRDNGISGIKKVKISGVFTDEDFEMLKIVFENKVENSNEGNLVLTLKNEQLIEFARDEQYTVECYTDTKKGDFISIENVNLFY